VNEINKFRQLTFVDYNFDLLPFNHILEFDIEFVIFVSTGEFLECVMSLS